MTAADGDRPRYVPALDGLRALAVLLVLWSHVLPATQGYPDWLKRARLWLAPGEFGVEIFFVLSGFLITRILLAERRRRQPVRWFLLRRFLRIFPIYYLLLAVMAFVEPGPTLFWCALYLSNFYFMGHPEGSHMGPTWSLCVEEHFYLVWPLVASFARPVWARRVLLFFVMPGAVLGAAIVCHGAEPMAIERVIRYGSPFRFLSLGAGCLLAFAEPGLVVRPWRAAAIGAVLFAVGVVMWPVYWVLYARDQLGIGLPLQYAPAWWLVHSCLVATGLVLTVLGAAFAGSPLVQPLANPLPRAIGRISYGLYLYHFPIYHAVMGPQPTMVGAGLAVAVVFAVATASYWLVERPLLRLGARFR